MKKQITLLLVALLTVGAAIAQQQKYPPLAFGKGKFLGETMPLRDFAKAQQTEYDIENLYVVPNDLRRPVKVNENALPMGPDPLNQTQPATRMPVGLILNFTAGSSSEAGGVIPPDPAGRLDQTTIFVLFLTYRLKFLTNKRKPCFRTCFSRLFFLGSGNNDGDPIVMYDHLADRWFARPVQNFQ
ncbi:MAG: hypothetical protein R2793_10040 [Flavobacteriaceae bacterium]